MLENVEDNNEVQYAYAEDNDYDDDMLLMADTQSNTMKTNMWCLDLGCSNHVTGNKNGLTKLDELLEKVIKFTDCRHTISGGKKDIFVFKKNGRKSIIIDVSYVPSMTSNLISVGKLLAKGYNMKLENNLMKVYHGDGRLILKAPLADNRTFKEEINTVDHKCLSSTVREDKNWL